MRRRGASLMQLLVGITITVVLMAGLVQTMVTVWNAQAFALRMPLVQEDARNIARRLASGLRRATLCTPSDTGCQLDCAVENPTATSITVYNRNGDGTLSKILYGVAGTNFYRTEDTKTAALYSGATIALTYYTAPSYHSSTFTVYNAGIALPKDIIAVAISATVTRNGVTGTYQTFIRLRNSPKKASAAL